MTIMAVVVAIVITAVIGVISIRNLGSSDSDQMLLMLCETGEKNLDSYFNSVEQSVKTISSFAQGDLDDTHEDSLKTHVDRVRTLFGRVARQTNGVLTYYYRIDPAVSETVSGFWYTNLDGGEFEEHEVTDISRYDTEDTSQLVWFTVPKATGKPIWLPPYITDNLDVRVISYNVPIFRKEQFIGVIGIEIDYSTMASEVDHIKLFDNGYAFVTNEECELIYHPYIDTSVMTDETRPETPEGVKSNKTHITYTYSGVEKKGVWLPLSNGMRLFVSVPVSEIKSKWVKTVNNIIVASLVVLLIIGFLCMAYTGRIVKPLRDLTDAAVKVENGNYDFDLDYKGNDEIGILTRTFKTLVDHVRVQINDLSRRVFVDPMTHVRNKGAYSNYIQELQNRMDAGEDLEFAVGVFDCDHLKTINDTYGHDKGDIYLQSASKLICRVFQHSPVFRIGGDEFAVIMQNDDYRNRKDLVDEFDKAQKEINASAENDWEKVSVAMGIVDFDRERDSAIIDTMRHADKAMYYNKRAKEADSKDGE